MSWLAQSIAKSLRNDGDDDDNADENAKEEQHRNQSDPDPPSPPTLERGVKEDISELTKTLSRQFWGVASFLAPPPQSQPSPPLVTSDSSPHEASGTDAAGIDGIRGDFAEIGGKFRSGISKLSDNIKVSDFAKIASNFLQLGAEQGGSVRVEGAVGVTDEVVSFARDIAMHPETWLNFPLPDDDEDDEFDLSDAQQEHALAVESIVPRLPALRLELCPGHMSESCFWKIYFVLLHPKLDKHDAVVLSTPQVLNARAFLTPDLRSRHKVKPEQDLFESNTSYINELSVHSNAPSDSIPSERSTMDTDFETEKHPIQSTEIPIIDKSVIDEDVNSVKDQLLHSGVSSRVLEERDDDDDDGDDWLKEESSEVGAAESTIHIENEEDVSFSDLEEND